MLWQKAAGIMLAALMLAAALLAPTAALPALLILPGAAISLRDPAEGRPRCGTSPCPPRGRTLRLFLAHRTKPFQRTRRLVPLFREARHRARSRRGVDSARLSVARLEILIILEEMDSADAGGGWRARAAPALPCDCRSRWRTTHEASGPQLCADVRERRTMSSSTMRRICPTPINCAAPSPS